MAYQLENDPYIDPKTGILSNMFAVADQATLDRVEAEVTVAIIATVIEHPIAGEFDLQHLMAIHKKLFSSIYSWAGKLRTVEITKDETSFAPIAFLEQSAEKLF